MTREQARREIDSLDFYLQNHTDDYGEESHTAMMMAKDALSSSEIPTSCGDAISREAAIRAIEALQRPIMREESNYYQFKFSGMSEALGAVENLPSVTPQQRTGRWEYRNIANSTIVGYWCDNCHIGSSRTYNYCPNCGAKMEVEE